MKFKEFNLRKEHILALQDMYIENPTDIQSKVIPKRKGHSCTCSDRNRKDSCIFNSYFREYSGYFIWNKESNYCSYKRTI